jgi:two-component system chemotaxis sensor kinase CheA
MPTDMLQYKELFVRTAKEYVETLNDELLILEKEPSNAEAIDAIFRAAHSLKGQSAAMAYEHLGYLCHVIEDVFYDVKENRLALNSQVADVLFAALDSLTDSVESIDNQGNEIDVSDITEQLKNIAGVSTMGSGKSDHQQAVHSRGATQKAVKSKAPSPLKTPAAQEKDNNFLKIRSIPIKVELLDDIVGTLEELMIHRLTLENMIKKTNDEDLIQTQDKIDKLIELMHFQIMKIRAVPVNMVFEHFPRAVRDLGRNLNKQIELKIEGDELELDRTIVEHLDEPLTHIIRNAADHGIKDSGVITLSARYEKDYAVVTVSDNGGGIDWQAVAKKAGVDPGDTAAVRRAVFSGISTSGEVSLISGRGVGLEVVKKTIEDLGGSVDVESSGHGTSFSLRLPLTVSIAKAVVVGVGDERYALPATSIDRLLRVKAQAIVTNAGQEAFRHEDQEIPLMRLGEIFGQEQEETGSPNITHAVVVNVDGEKIAFGVDSITEAIETIIKPLPALLKGIRAFAGVSIVGDGHSVLLLNPRGLIK